MSDLPLNPAARRQGVLRVEFSGLWTAGEFGRLFSRLDFIYRRLASGYILLQEDSLERSGWWSWRELETLAEPLEPLEATTELLAGQLTLLKVEYASPGAAEVVGALNPLKVIGDGIQDWRHENTIRAANEEAARLEDRRLDQEQQRINIERERADREYELQLLDRLSSLPLPVQDRLLAKLLGEPRTELRRIATDIRVGEVESHELPPAS